MKTNQDAQIQWQVATPMVNAALFNVEYSKDAKQWQSIGSVSVTDPNQSVFQFIHQQVPKGMAYYRIRQEDLDGQYIHSRVVYLSGKQTSTVRIYPNPADAYLMVDCVASSTTAKTLQLTDKLGRILFTRSFAGRQTLIPVSQLPNGSYFLNITDRNEISIEHVLIQR